MVPSGCTVHPAARARAARTSFMSERVWSGKLPCCRSPASIRLVMARRCRSRSFVRSFSRSRSLSPRLRDGPADGAGPEAKPRGRRCGGGDGSSSSPSASGRCGSFMLVDRCHPAGAGADLPPRELEAEAPHARSCSVETGLPLRFDHDWTGSICHVSTRSRPLILDRTVRVETIRERSSRPSTTSPPSTSPAPPLQLCF